MSEAVTSKVSVKLHAADMYEILLGKKRLGYVRRHQPDGPAPINWLPSSVGGVNLTTTSRIEIVKKVRELMADEWDAYEAEQQQLRDLENGLAAAESGGPGVVESDPLAPAEE